jgi:SAM-dependent methyltransferase
MKVALNGQLDGGIDGEVALVLEHDRVPFPSFPYEWPAELLYQAASLTLDLNEALLGDGLGLKDATPYNILFRGAEPVLTDVLSVEGRDPHDPTWLPYAQFVRTFVLPLLLNKYFGVPLSEVFLTRRDGLEPEEVYRLCGWWRKFVPPFLTLVSIPKWLSARRGAQNPKLYRKRAVDDVERARFIVGSLLKHSRRALRRVEPRQGRGSTWSGYTESNQYTSEEFAAKQRFVEHVVAEFQPRRVLDVGCNTGTFSRVAARGGARVVAIDYDPVVVGELWRVAHTDALDILPLVVDLTRPSPAVGWRNSECLSFLDRARGAFDAVLMLAVVHHMLVSERIPLAEIIALAADLTTDLAVIEFVGPEDAMFRRLARGRDELFVGLTHETFEQACQRRFRILRSEPVAVGLDTRRWLYLLRKREARADA